MPEIILGLAALLAGIYLAMRWLHGGGAARRLGEAREAGRGAGGPAFRLFGSQLSRVIDPRLAATILMVQLVRSGSYVSEAEKAQILELMASGLGIRDGKAMLARAWDFTDRRRAFAPVAEELAPMLRRRLNADEGEQLVEMLLSVANSYSEASDLQLANIALLRRRLGVGEEQRAW